MAVRVSPRAQNKVWKTGAIKVDNKLDTILFYRIKYTARGCEIYSQGQIILNEKGCKYIPEFICPNSGLEKKPKLLRIIISLIKNCQIYRAVFNCKKGLLC